MYKTKTINFIKREKQKQEDEKKKKIEEEKPPPKKKYLQGSSADHKQYIDNLLKRKKNIF